jgi:RNA polymerase sigma-70 factor (ECF subfamily)
VNSSSAQTPEDALVLRIADGDQGAVGLLYDRLGGWIYSLAISIVRVEADAEEVTQEVFLSLWRKAERYSPDRGSVRAWLAVITRRLAIDRTRARSYRESKRSAPETELTHLADTSAAQSIVDSAESRNVADAMQRLDENQRIALQMSYYEGYSHSEIAQKLSVPLGTVKSRIRSGMTELRRMLQIE